VDSFLIWPLSFSAFDFMIAWGSLQGASHWLVALFALLIPQLYGCAAPSVEDRNVARAPSTKERAGNVIKQPWYDLNLSKTVIPPLLIRASAAPYAAPADAGCAGLKHEIDAFNKVLGPDLQPTHIDNHDSLLSRKKAGDASWSVASGLVNGFIPFRGVIRVFTGADAHEKAVGEAIIAGIARRAYLEGMARAQSCSFNPRRQTQW
jgi:hypothetical protein